MNIEGQISILVNREYTTIEVRDRNAITTFCTVKLTPEQLSAALFRQVQVKCDVKVRGIDRLGKKHENKDFIFELPKHLQGYDADRDEIRKLGQFLIDEDKEGWILDGGFRSQNSFFKDGKDRHMARAIARRWI